MKINLMLIVWIVAVSSICHLGYGDENDGKEVVLRPFLEKDVVCVGIDKKRYNDLMSNRMAKEEKNYLTQCLNHQGFELNLPTKARIKSTNFWEQTVEVEILDGPYAGETGWVLYEHALGY